MGLWRRGRRRGRRRRRLDRLVFRRLRHRRRRRRDFFRRCRNRGGRVGLHRRLGIALKHHRDGGFRWLVFLGGLVGKTQQQEQQQADVQSSRCNDAVPQPPIGDAGSSAVRVSTAKELLEHGDYRGAEGKKRSPPADVATKGDETQEGKAGWWRGG